MKRRIITILLAVLMLVGILPFAGCSLLGKIFDYNKDDGSSGTPAADKGYGSDDCDALAQNAIQLVATGDPQLLKRLLPEGEIEYFVDYYQQKGSDYYELVRAELEANAEEYKATCGEDWKITYTVTQNNEKDSDGIQHYREFDDFYFEQYNIDPSKITAVNYTYYEITVSGSLGSNTKQKSMWLFCYEGRWYSFYMPRFGLKLV